MSYLRTIRASIWVGWHREFSWTHPVAGLSIKTIAPVASVLTASTVYYLGAIRAGTFNSAQLTFILVGASLYFHIAAYSWVPTLAIAEGKWSYVFTHVYMSPKSSPPYLAGRCLAAFVTSTITSILALVAAYFLALLIFKTQIPLVVTPLSASLLFLALVVNILASMGLGFLLSAYAIFASKFEWALPVYIAGLLMVFSEALFPVSILPHPVSDVANVLPFTQFIRAARDALVYDSLSSYMYHIGLAVVGGIVFLALGLLAFRWGENRARRTGVIDKKVV